MGGGGGGKRKGDTLVRKSLNRSWDIGGKREGLVTQEGSCEILGGDISVGRCVCGGEGGGEEKESKLLGTLDKPLKKCKREGEGE